MRAETAHVFLMTWGFFSVKKQGFMLHTVPGRVWGQSCWFYFLIGRFSLQVKGFRETAFKLSRKQGTS